MSSLIIAESDMSQHKQMPSQLLDFPDELLEEVLGCLPKSDLKIARLTCTRFGRNGARWLFQRVYFAPRQSTMDTFLNISSNPAFARTVTELVYDGRLFIEELTSYKSYKEALDDWVLGDWTEDINHDVEEIAMYIGPQVANFGQEQYHEFLTDTLVHYTRLLGQQQQIFEGRKDYEALCAGFKDLPNITTVIALDYVSEGCDRVSLRTNDHSWYRERSEREIAMPFAPSSWSRYKSREKWDSRGIQNLFRAVSEHSRNLVELHIGSGYSSAPMSIFELDQDGCAEACRMVRRLNLLELHLYKSKSSSWTEWYQQEDRLGAILSEAKNLRCLAIRDGFDIRLLKNKVWPRLETLDFGNTGLRAEELKAISQIHKDTLHEINFRNVNIIGDEGWKETEVDVRFRKLGTVGVGDDMTSELTEKIFGDEGWAGAAKEMVIPMRFRKLDAVGEGDEMTRESTESPTHFELEVRVAVAGSFTQTISQTILSKVEDGITIVPCPAEDQDRNIHPA